MHKMLPECADAFKKLKGKTEEIARDSAEIKKVVTNHYTELSASQQRIEKKFAIDSALQKNNTDWLRYLVTGIVVVFGIGMVTGVGLWIFDYFFAE